MSRSLSARCLHRTVFSLPPSPSQAIPRPSPGGRRQYGFAALKTRPQADRNYPRRPENPPPYSRAVPHEPGIRLQQGYSREQSDAEREPPPREREREPRQVYVDEDEQAGEGSSSGTARRVGRSTGEQSTRQDAYASPRPDYSRATHANEIFADHLNGLFPALKFPLEVSARILTHASHPMATHGHNAQFSFIGRREIVSRVLNTYFLGEHIGTKWGLGRVMRWTPTIAAAMLKDEARADKAKLLKDAGLYKVQGDAVAAVIGGIFQQFGASVAHRVFHTRLLPRLLSPEGGLPMAFHADAHEACARLGGAHGALLLDSDAPTQEAQKAVEALPSPTPNRPTPRH
ncbi:hypothetical protein B0H17DRAFT_1087126 [Mycena rosella]|uniref:RNase III domain-containing protein n=1 Tax=Mycena rosella TaxID=1033263 RepID=A0AAD7CXU5_MYCRO|nr:hypothetical protein B0H17DRAFT_1087126 [Mycena rosella]